ncbi:39S Ribosomal Protein L33 [Manis pentadactyla]|nr:39S Ribosomal Protein L33 [Manis pentadactyla]
MLLSAVTFAKSKSKTILVKMLSQAGTGFCFNAKRNRLQEKLTLLHFDPIGPSSVVSVPVQAMEPQCHACLRAPSCTLDAHSHLSEKKSSLCRTEKNTLPLNNGLK